MESFQAVVALTKIMAPFQMSFSMGPCFLSQFTHTISAYIAIPLLNNKSKIYLFKVLVRGLIFFHLLQTFFWFFFHTYDDRVHYNAEHF